jgi:cell division protein FtsQ
MKRSIMFWLYFVIAIVLGVYFATRIVTTGLGHGKLATIHNIRLLTDDKDADLTAVQTVAASALGSKTNSLRLDSLNHRIDDIPNVQFSSVRRMPNGTLRIRAKFYHAVALWTDGDAFYPLASDGTIIRTPTESRDASAIVFRGTLPTNISEITSAAHVLGSHIDYLEWIENRRWNIHTTNGITIKLPENDFSYAISSLTTINKNHNILERAITVIDMRDPARILVR